MSFIRTTVCHFRMFCNLSIKDHKGAVRKLGAASLFARKSALPGIGFLFSSPSPELVRRPHPPSSGWPPFNFLLNVSMCFVFPFLLGGGCAALPVSVPSHGMLAAEIIPTSPLSLPSEYHRVHPQGAAGPFMSSPVAC